MFEGMTKHTGILASTGKNVVVVFMSLPDDPDNALVVDTDALPDAFNEALRKVVDSTEGQQAENLAEVLARRMSPDGSNTTLLQKFHSAGRLQKVPVDLVTMTPRRGVNWPLRQILEAMQNVKSEEPIGFDELDPETKAAIAADLKKFNVHATNTEGETASGKKAEAANLVRMAELLEADAQAKREQAYKIDPSLVKVSKKNVYSVDVSDLSPVEAVKVVKAEQKKVAAKKTTTTKKPATKSKKTNVAS